LSEEDFVPQPVDAFGGLCTFLERSEVPVGMSPNCSDIEFRPKTILSRPGLGLRFTDDSAFRGIKSFYGLDRVRRLVTLQDSGKLSVETPEGQLTQIQHMYQSGGLLKAVYAFGRLWMCFSDGKRPLDFPAVYDPLVIGTDLFPVRPVNMSAPPLIPIAADSASAGLITAGTHYYFYTFEDRFGFITQQSYVSYWTAAGGKKADFSSLAPGWANAGAACVRRRIWMSPAYVTGAGVSGFFNIGALIVDDNTSTTLGGVSFTDATLQDGVIWKTDNLTLVPPPPAIGVTKYADRLVFWGVYPGIEPRLAQRLDGRGTDILLLGLPAVDFSGQNNTNPVGWVIVSGAAKVMNQASTYASFGTRTGERLQLAGHIHQDASNLLSSSSQDNQYWLKPGARYGFLVRADGGSAGGTLTISMIAQTVGPTTLATATLTLPPAPSGVSTNWQIYAVDGTANVPNGELGIRFDLTSAGCNVDWIRPYLQANKFDGSTVWIGDNLIPQNFDLVKSPLPVAPGDWQEIRCCFEQTGNLYIVKEHSTWVTADNGQDPSTWGIDNVSFQMGTPSVHGVGIGPEFVIIAGREGVYRFDSGSINKISQEIETTWQGIDWTQGHLLWATVDPTLKLIRVAVPLKTGPAGVCNVILKCDYTEGWGEAWTYDQAQVQEAGNRKWSIDKVATICGEMAEKDDGSLNLLVGGVRSSSNNLFDGWLTSFDKVGTRAAAVTLFQAQPMGKYVGIGNQFGTQWAFPFSSGTARYVTTSTIVPAIGAYFVASFWAMSPTAGVNVPVTIRDPFLLADVAIVITPAWKRFVAVFGPNASVGPHETIDIDFGTLSAPVTVVIFGPQLQSGQFDLGWTGVDRSDGSNNVGTGLPSGCLSEPIVYAPGSVPPWKTQDWDSAITPTYEFAPFGLALGRSNFNKIIARIRGNGALQAFFVRPDGSTSPLNAGAFPLMNTNPTNDIEMGGAAQDTYVGVRLLTQGILNWFSLKRFGIFSRGHEGAPYRGKS
jgi:hypothetical protein